MHHLFLACLATVLIAACATPASTPPETQAPAPVRDGLAERSAPPQSPPPPRPIAAPELKAPQVTVLQLLPPGITDRAGWAADIQTAFAVLGLPPNAANLCAAMAVIEQESTWQAEPVVPGLPVIVRAEIEKRRSRYGIPKLLLDAALSRRSPDGRSYQARIDTLRNEKQMSQLFDDMISELPYGRTLLADQNPVHTGGPMQVSFAFAEAHVRERTYPYSRRGSLRDEVFTRRGGVYFGIANLLAYPAGYPAPLYRFADFNAGRYSSRNAAFQFAVARLTRTKLTLDGDLLRYVDGKPSGTTSQTQAALEKLTGKLGLSRAQIIQDLIQEKAPGFESTTTWRRVFSLADQALGQAMPRQRLPGIDLKSPKIQRKLTTEWFARRVDGRYRSCLARAEAGAV